MVESVKRERQRQERERKDKLISFLLRVTILVLSLPLVRLPLIPPKPTIRMPSTSSQLKPTRGRNRIRILVPRGYLHTPYQVEDPWNLDDDKHMHTTTQPQRNTLPPSSPPPSPPPPRRRRPTAPTPTGRSSSSSPHNTNCMLRKAPFVVESHRILPPPSRAILQDDPPDITETQMSKWLNSTSEDPYIKLEHHLIQHLRPQMNIWIKYQNTVTHRLLPGGVFLKNGYPDYIMLRNPHNGIAFSVQLLHADLYTRKSALSPLSPLL